MRHMKTGMLCLISVIALTACEKRGNGEFSKTLKNVNVIDESNLNDIMLTVADPNEAVTYFQKATQDNPDRLDLQRGLGTSLLRAKRATEAAVIWAKITKHPEATNDDQISYANALVRQGEWKKAEKVLDGVPPTFENFERYRLEAIIADTNKEWNKADSFYQTAVGLTTTPGSVLNNWGFSKLTRGDYDEAERLFGEAITYDPSLFTAKNNMILARGARKNYTLPIIQVTQTERAQLLHTMALTAIKQGDVEIGKTLLEEAIETHPQHFEAAIRSLRTLES
ncbi:tetratricopeptide repeat protein [Litoreibacter arenae]|uniref:Flp pilus assembly protein TadD n=1 Tax=Litoreibacter arenae DSM 19593 TaxID=1123360 RepID=S9QMG7_9RHOB|nr:tetratricopeptide repeat protein [Litoreibacter arenae]EPX80783.1 Flp pilus assembly protein TadD [Litoreibacter arenae DSM 19593]